MTPKCRIFLMFMVNILCHSSIYWCTSKNFSALRAVNNQLEEDLSTLKEEMALCALLCKHNGKASTNRQLQTTGKDSCQKLAKVEQKCPQSDCMDGDCCCDSVDLEPSLASSVLQPDFVLESTGGSIVSTGSTEPFESGSTWIFGTPICYSRNDLIAVIQASVEPGECWVFKGDSGSVAIQLIGYVFISGVSLEHIPKSISPSGNIDSAPKDFSIVGLTSSGEYEDGKELGRFTYNSDGPPVQYFAIDGHSQSYEIVKLKIHSNYGNLLFTCVYRLQVHGKFDEDKIAKLEGK